MRLANQFVLCGGGRIVEPRQFICLFGHDAIRSRFISTQKQRACLHLFTLIVGVDQEVDPPCVLVGLETTRDEGRIPEVVDVVRREVGVRQAGNAILVEADERIARAEPCHRNIERTHPATELRGAGGDGVDGRIGELVLRAQADIAIGGLIAQLAVVVEHVGDRCITHVPQMNVNRGEGGVVIEEVGEVRAGHVPVLQRTCVDQCGATRHHVGHVERACCRRSGLPVCQTRDVGELGHVGERERHIGHVGHIPAVCACGLQTVQAHDARAIHEVRDIGDVRSVPTICRRGECGQLRIVAEEVLQRGCLRNVHARTIEGGEAQVVHEPVLREAQEDAALGGNGENRIACGGVVRAPSLFNAVGFVEMAVEPRQIICGRSIDRDRAVGVLRGGGNTLCFSDRIGILCCGLRVARLRSIDARLCALVHAKNQVAVLVVGPPSKRVGFEAFADHVAAPYVDERCSISGTGALIALSQATR